MLNVGLVGFGFAGKTFHAPVIRVVEGLRLTTIVQRHGGGAPGPPPPEGGFRPRAAELLSPAGGLVVVAPPHTSPQPIAQQRLLAGRHPVTHKTITTTPA